MTNVQTDQHHKRAEDHVTINYDMPASEYHAHPAISNSQLSSLAKSPRHFWALHRDTDRKPSAPTAAMSAGTLLHTFALEPQLMSAYAVRPADLDARTKDGREWLAQHAEQQVISADQFAAAQAQMAALREVDVIADIMRTGRAEASVFWRDEASGVECRARPDWLHRPSGKGRDIIALDVKTTVDAAPDAFSRSINTYGYHRQAVHYTAGLEAEGFRVISFVFAVVSSTYPFVAAAYVLDDATIAQAEQERAELLDTYARCTAANEWPAYGAGLQLIGLPAWARRAEEIEVGYV